MTYLPFRENQKNKSVGLLAIITIAVDTKAIAHPSLLMAPDI